jgi:tetratricopeptide (TPR) repeat protein
MDYSAAAGRYESALRTEPGDADALWRLARIYVVRGEATETTERKELLQRAEEYARRCIRADSTAPQGHTWLAGALGFKALDAGMSDQVRLARELVDETARALRLDPRDDIALSIRGSFFRALGNVGWLKRQLAALLLGAIPRGGYEESEEALLRAIEIAPDVMRHRYELGVLYLDMGREEEARRAFEEALRLQIRVTSDVPREKKIRELLGEIVR